jgi:hypothetical protein
MELHVGDLVEVLADDPVNQYWYGEVCTANPVTVNYISLFKHDVWRFDENAYHVDRQCINHVIDMTNRSKVSGWRELGFVYRGEHEIISIDDVDSEEEDEEWLPGDESEEEGGDDDEEDGAESDDDELIESEPDDVINTDEEEEEEEESEGEEEEEEPPPKRTKTKKCKTAVGGKC